MITISLAISSDVAKIRKLGLETKELQVHNDGHPMYYPEDSLRAFFESPNDIALVAKVDNTFAGYFIATFNPYLKEAYLIDLVVKPEFRKQGISNELIDRMLVELQKKECRWSWCLVHDDNEKIQTLLEKKGFKRGKIFVFYYKELTT